MLPSQQRLIDETVERLSTIPGVIAVVLSGSHARNRARSDSDIDLSLYYYDDSRFDIASIRALAEDINDTPDPVVSGFGEWGRWVDGGAWLTVAGQRLDFLYRQVNLIQSTLSEAKSGRFEVDFTQQPPFGYFGPTVLGEVAIARALHDPTRLLPRLKAEVSPMPEPLCQAIIRNCLWDVEFGLQAFAPKYVAGGNVYGSVGCFTRFVRDLILVLFALNRAYFISDKTALAELSEFSVQVPQFTTRATKLLGAAGDGVDGLTRALTLMQQLFQETAKLADGQYRPAWRF